jgi:hypothetical protein
MFGHFGNSLKLVQNKWTFVGRFLDIVGPVCICFLQFWILVGYFWTFLDILELPIECLAHLKCFLTFVGHFGHYQTLFWTFLERFVSVFCNFEQFRKLLVDIFGHFGIVPKQMHFV